MVSERVSSSCALTQKYPYLLLHACEEHALNLTTRGKIIADGNYTASETGISFY